MAINKQAYQLLIDELSLTKTSLVAVSKTKTIDDILELYELGQRNFGENYVQELVTKSELLPKDIRWHYIGHLQSNKVKYIVPFIHLIHGVDSDKLLKEINKQGEKIDRVINCLLQVYIAQEETKFGFDEEELANVLMCKFANVQICGLMGMASFTEEMEKVRNEFMQLKTLFDKLNAQYSIFNIQFSILSMGMSSDYKIAIEEGSNMVRIGSLIFGERV